MPRCRSQLRAAVCYDDLGLGRHHLLFGDDFAKINPCSPRQIRCRAAGKLVVFGGPFPTGCPDECAPYCDVQVLNEGELTWPMFLHDLRRGEYRALYTSDEKPDITSTPIPTVRPDQRRRLPGYPDPVLARMSVSLRVLRHHRHVRPEAAHQDAGTDLLRTGVALPDRLPRHPCSSSTTTLSAT